jgi:glycosyltransferase involved in cell wall biosynthesis
MYHPDLIRGGSQRVAYELFTALKGREAIAPFFLASSDQNSIAANKDDLGIINFDQREDEFLFLSQDYDYDWQRTECESLTKTFSNFLNSLKPDVVHFHHFMTLGIDYLSLTRRILPNAKIIYTAHDFWPLCAAGGHMVRVPDGSLCERPSGIKCQQCRPEHNADHYVLRQMWFKAHLEAANVMTVPSNFMNHFYADWGIAPEKLRHIENGITSGAWSTDTKPASARKNRFGFFGQLVNIKGIHILLEAVELLRNGGLSDFSVEINGDNLHFASPEMQTRIKDFLEREAKRPPSERNVSFNGPYDPASLGERMHRVDWVVVPSTWREVFCLVVSEAWNYGRPVIASNIGSLAERVTDGLDGMLFSAGNAYDLAEKMQMAIERPETWDRLHKGISPPISQNDMADKFLELYLTS